MDESIKLEGEQLQLALETACAQLASWRDWGAQVLFDWAGIEKRPRADDETQLWLALTFGQSLGGMAGLQRDLRMLVAHQRGVVRLTESFLARLDDCAAHSVAGSREPAGNERGDVPNGATSPSEQVEQGPADGDQHGEPKL